MPRDKISLRGFALYEVLIGVTIFVVGILALGRSVENCLNASELSATESQIRLVLANRMAEIQAAPGPPDTAKESKIQTANGTVKLLQKSAPAGLKEEQGLELGGIQRVSLIAEWTRGGVKQSEQLIFYVYRAG